MKETLNCKCQVHTSVFLFLIIWIAWGIYDCIVQLLVCICYKSPSLTEQVTTLLGVQLLMVITGEWSMSFAFSSALLELAWS